MVTEKTWLGTALEVGDVDPPFCYRMLRILGSLLDVSQSTSVKIIELWGKFVSGPTGPNPSKVPTRNEAKKLRKKGDCSLQYSVPPKK